MWALAGQSIQPAVQYVDMLQHIRLDYISFVLTDLSACSSLQP
jgi:hypothetical protein